MATPSIFSEEQDAVLLTTYESLYDPTKKKQVNGFWTKIAAAVGGGLTAKQCKDRMPALNDRNYENANWNGADTQLLRDNWKMSNADLSKYIFHGRRSANNIKDRRNSLTRADKRAASGQNKQRNLRALFSGKEIRLCELYDKYTGGRCIGESKWDYIAKELAIPNVDGRTVRQFYFDLKQSSDVGTFNKLNGISTGYAKSTLHAAAIMGGDASRGQRFKASTAASNARKSAKKKNKEVNDMQEEEDSEAMYNMSSKPFGDGSPPALPMQGSARGSGMMSSFPSGVNGGPPQFDMPSPNAAPSFGMPSNVARGSGKMSHPPSLPDMGFDETELANAKAEHDALQAHASLNAQASLMFSPSVPQPSGGAPSFRDAMCGMAQQFSLQSTVSPPGVSSVVLQDMPFSLPGREEEADNSSM